MLSKLLLRLGTKNSLQKKTTKCLKCLKDANVDIEVSNTVVVVVVVVVVGLSVLNVDLTLSLVSDFESVGCVKGFEGNSVGHVQTSHLWRRKRRKKWM